MGFRRWSLGVVLIASTWTVAAQENGDPAKAECHPMMARFLPGEFNYCLAERAWHRTKYPYALEMFQLSASWGSKSAQQVLGVVYFNGEHTPGNRPLGLAWLGLAAERGESRRKAMFQSAWQKASPEERREAERLYADLRTTYGDGIAAQRAERRFERELKQFRANPVYGAGTCVAGTIAAWGSAGISNTSGERSTGCTLMAEDRVVRALEEHLDVYLHGWKGRVEIGPLENADSHPGR